MWEAAFALAECGEKPRYVVGLEHHVVRRLHLLVVEADDLRPGGGESGPDPQTVLSTEIGQFPEEQIEPVRQVVRPAALLGLEHPIHRARSMVVRGTIANFLPERLADDRPRRHQLALLGDDPVVLPSAELLHLVHEREVPRPVARGKVGEVREHLRNETFSTGKIDRRPRGTEFVPRHDAEFFRDLVGVALDELLRGHRAAAVPDDAPRRANAAVRQRGLFGIDGDHLPPGDAVHRGGEGDATTVVKDASLGVEFFSNVLVAEVEGNDVRCQGVLHGENGPGV